MSFGSKYPLIIGKYQNLLILEIKLKIFMKDYISKFIKFCLHAYGEMLVSHLPVLLSITDKICT